MLVPSIIADTIAEAVLTLPFKDQLEAFQRFRSWAWAYEAAQGLGTFERTMGSTLAGCAEGLVIASIHGFGGRQ